MVKFIFLTGNYLGTKIFRQFRQFHIFFEGLIFEIRNFNKMSAYVKCKLSVSAEGLKI